MNFLESLHSRRKRIGSFQLIEYFSRGFPPPGWLSPVHTIYSIARTCVHRRSVPGCTSVPAECQNIRQSSLSARIYVGLPSHNPYLKRYSEFSGSTGSNHTVTTVRGGILGIQRWTRHWKQSRILSSSSIAINPLSNLIY